jgi:hypothetical protein
VDNASIIDQCFKHDSQLWKIERLSKVEFDLKETKNTIKEHYKLMKDIFVLVASNSKYPFITMSDFIKFAETLKDAQLNQSAIDNIFIASNILSAAAEYRNNLETNPPNMLVRY